VSQLFFRRVVEREPDVAAEAALLKIPLLGCLPVGADTPIAALGRRPEGDAKRVIEGLKAKKKAGEARLGEAKQVVDKAREDVKTGTGKAWEELRPAIQSAIARFKEA
jgi:hypothetical protein